MTELSDYRRMIEAPMIRRWEDRAAKMQAEIERLRAVALKAHAALTKSSLTADERVHDATGVLATALPADHPRPGVGSTDYQPHKGWAGP